MKIKVKGGKAVSPRIDSVYIGRTYAGLLEGIPSKADDDARIEKLKTQAVKLLGWGPFSSSGEKVYGRKAHPILIAPTPKKWGISTATLPKIIKDDLLKRNPNMDKLPNYYVFAMLDGSPTDENSCGAVALVIFFTDSLKLSVEDMVEQACNDELWEFMAYNYDI